MSIGASTTYAHARFKSCDIRGWLLCTLLLLSGCNPAETDKPAPRPPQSVTTVQPQAGHIDETLTLGCRAVPRDAVDVASELAGLRILSLDADAGDEIRKGQVMAHLDTATLDLQLAQLASQRERAEEEYDRLARLKPSGGVSLDQLSEKRLAMQGLQAQYAETELRKARAIITAPTAGWVYERSARIGQVVNAGEPLFRMARDGVIEADCDVPEQHVARVAPGQSLTLAVSGQAGNPGQARVRVVYPQIHAERRIAPLRASIAWPERPAVGTWMEGRLPIARHSGPSLPLTTLQKDSQGDFVWSVVEGRVQRQAVEVVYTGTAAVILRDMPAGLTIIARSGALLREGTPVVEHRESLP
jgi:HlyD family secretion protein